MITKYTEYIKENLSSKTEIKNWLDEMDITNYTINDDLSIDVDGDINISFEKLIEIPIKFNKVNGNFGCNGNKLTSLENCPVIVNGDFSCSDNNLTSLEGCPKIISGYFFCIYNPNLVDINDLDSKILIKNINRIDISQEVYDKYFEYWIDKDFNIFDVLKDKVSYRIKQKYSHLFQANNFDLI